MDRVTALAPLIVEAGGTVFTAESLRALGEVRVQQRLSQPTLCELVFRDPPGPLEGTASLLPGTALRVGVQGRREPLFVGEVTAVEHVYEPAHGREVRVRGYDLLHRLRKQQTVRAHVQVRVGDLARELVSGLGLQVQADATGPVWERIFQHYPSDLELLVAMAERCGLYLTVREQVLHLLTLDGRDEPLALALGESLLEARIDVNGDPACRAVLARGWNPARVESHQDEVSTARVGRDIASEVQPGRFGVGGERQLLNQVLQDDEHAGLLAQADLDRQVAREVTLWGVAEGDPRLRPGSRAMVNGVADALRGQYVLTAVTHLVDEQHGFISELSSAPPPRRERPPASVAALGVVTRVDDPQDLARVRVSLPAYGDVETDWLGVLSPGAGENKGLVALPDVGAQVLVLLAQEDPAQGVVLGGLYGLAGAPDSGVEGGSVRRYTLLTPGGQRLRLDDVAQTIRVENSDGSYIELAPQKVRVHAATDLEIEAPGHSLVIRAQAIDFERG